jgi:protein-disulfide isomerase
MPAKVQAYRRQNEQSSKRMREVLLIAACVVAGIVILVVLLTRQTSTIDVAFRAREMGPADAKVVVDIFSDFQCPWCGVFARGPESKLVTEYVDKNLIRVVYRNYLVVDSFVANGTESHLAANAALCAGDQGMFWEFHDALFLNQSSTENSGNFSSPRLYALAVQMKLDGIAFQQCMTDQTHKNVIDGDTAMAVAYNINSTPTFLVNGKLVTIKTTDFQQLFDEIDIQLAALGGS